jgi:hypothetical protein
LLFLALFVCHCLCQGSRIHGIKEETHVKDFCCGKSQTANEKKSVIIKTWVISTNSVGALCSEMKDKRIKLLLCQKKEGSFVGSFL